MPTEANRRILMTGGFGFVGGHMLTKLLEASQTTIHVVDNLSSNPIEVETLLGHLPYGDRLTYDLVSIREYFATGPADFDAIVHLASPVGPAGVLKHGGRIVSSVVDDAYLLADYAIERGARLVDVSTSEVYGGGRDGLCDEEDDKIVPAETSFRLEYAIGKLAAETALINLNRRDGLDVVIIRPFNIAGPRQSGEGGFVLPRFIAQAMLGLPLTIFGNGAARRAFTHVDDVAIGMVQALQNGSAGTAYNLGNHENVITVDGLADIVLDVTDSSSEKRYVDPTQVYGRDFVEANDKFPSAGRAIRELGWSPRHDVRQVVVDSFEYMRAAPSRDFARLAGGKVIEQLLEAQQMMRLSPRP
jgi:nucleoside-diphosphate-sugar epimerase